MMTECPRCRMMVPLKEDGTCKFCGKAPDDTEGIDPNKVAMPIGPLTELPKVCYVCGQFADKTRKFSRGRSNPHFKADDDPIIRPGFSWLGILAPLITFLSTPRMGHDQITLTIPVCSRCGVTELEIDHIDWEHSRVRIVCHRLLREAYRRAKESSS